MPLSVYGPERGLVIARGSFSQDALYVHFAGRHDAFFAGHSNADRGTFTLSADHITWVPELPWRDHIRSDKHSILFVDGKAQYDLKAPCRVCYMIRWTMEQA